MCKLPSLLLTATEKPAGRSIRGTLQNQDAGTKEPKRSEDRKRASEVPRNQKKKQEVVEEEYGFIS